MAGGNINCKNIAAAADFARTDLEAIPLACANLGILMEALAVKPEAYFKDCSVHHLVALSM